MKLFKMYTLKVYKRAFAWYYNVKGKYSIKRKVEHIPTTM